MGSTDQSFRVAIVGGGLCGLSLAIALKKRSIPYTIYESRASFTEIGAGINLGPNTSTTFTLIDESLGEALEKLCTHNPPGKENVWMQIRFGAPTARFNDGQLITELMAPPTGNTTVRRNDLLAMLAERAGAEHAAFNKKLVDLSQDDSGVTLTFADGTSDTASAVIACDGIHSAVRRALVGPDSKAATPQFSECGGYRAVLSRERLEQAVGPEIANTSNVVLGPDAYVIMYPVEGKQSVNTGLWPWKRGAWTEQTWMLPAQKKQMEEQFKDWGDTVHKIMDLMPDPPFFASHHHAIQPDSFFKGRICLIGDAAHSMPPHQGAGSGQAMEDAYVVAEVLGAVPLHNATQRDIEAALKGYEDVRRPRSQKVLETSVEAMGFWSDWYRRDLTDEDVKEYVDTASGRFQWIWYDDIAGQAQKARNVMSETLDGK